MSGLPCPVEIVCGGETDAGTRDEALNPYLRSVAARTGTSAPQVRAASTSCGRLVRLPGAELGGQFLPPLILVFVFGDEAALIDGGMDAYRAIRHRRSSGAM